MALPFHDARAPSAISLGTWGLIAMCIFVFAFLQPKPMQGLTHGLSLQDASEAEIQVRHFQDRWALVPCELTHLRSIAQGAACNGYPSDEPTNYVDKNVITPVFTSLFLHATVLHLISNLLFLWLFGRILEERIGGIGVVALFVAGGIAASLAYVAVNPESMVPVLGASGAIAALMGAVLILEPRRKILSLVYAAGVQVIYLPTWAVLAFFFVSQFFTAPGAQVAWQAHVGGMVFGMIVASIWAWRDPLLRPDREAPETLLDDLASEHITLMRRRVDAPASGPLETPFPGSSGRR